MSHTFNYPGFFSTWHQSNKKYDISADTDAAIVAMARRHASKTVAEMSDHPFCDEPRCDCHNLALNGQTFIECIEQPITDGLLTTAEGLRLYWGEQI